MDPFELINIMFTNPIKYNSVSNLDKKKNFFILNRRFAINFPLQSQLLQHIRINDVAVIDCWQIFIRKQYNKVPYWMYAKGVKKTVEQKEKIINIKENVVKEFARYYNYDLKSVRESIKTFPDQIKKELNNFEKTVMS